MSKKTVKGDTMDNSYIDKTTFDSVREASKQTVAKRNDFIQNTRYSLGLLQNKILLYMFSKVKPTDKPNQLYEFRFSEMFAVLRYKTDSYTEVKRLIQSMNALSFWRDAENDDEDDELISFFDSDSVVANAKRGFFKVRFGKKVFPYILELRKQQEEDGTYFTGYQLQNVILMKHYYSQRLYEILRSYKLNNQKWVFEIGTKSKNDLQLRLLGGDKSRENVNVPEGWKKWSIFNRDVLKPAEADINQYTDIKIKYIPSKYDLRGNKHRGYASVTFAMISKTLGEIEETNRYIDAQYREFLGEEEEYHQSTLDEFLAFQNNKLAEEENEISRNTKAKEMEIFEARVNTSQYPIITEELGEEFTDEEIDNLVVSARKHMSIGEIDKDKQELWLSDYIVYYLEKIRMTPQDTKTTQYKRLLNLLQNDYDNISNAISLKYGHIESKMDRYITELGELRTKGDWI